MRLRYTQRHPNILDGQRDSKDKSSITLYERALRYVQVHVTNKSETKSFIKKVNQNLNVLYLHKKTHRYKYDYYSVKTLHIFIAHKR